MSQWQRIETIFLKAVNLPAGEQARFLADACGDDLELFREIKSLIAADPGSGAAIETIIQQEADHFFEAQSLIGERVGSYRIVQEIGRGGMGTVYLANRTDDEYHNEVAIKVVKRGMDTLEVLKRFRYERQILAHLAHPYIARLFDGGSTNDGLPFFVMEYVQGSPIHLFCRTNALDFDQRCGLFLHVLEAVAYAHRNLVVHRDLKPSNILVTAEGTPKLLDFGVARLLGAGGDADQTATAVPRAYTSAYASPEQVRGASVTTATDIYSLGIVFYELLTSQPAQPIEHLTPAAIERRVCDTEIQRPSLIARSIPSDLDNIVLMATRKEPERRYQSATQFAEDIQRYLDGRPVIARQDSSLYRGGKFILRNRLQVAMAAVVAVSLLAGAVVALVQARRAQASGRTAEFERLIAIQQRAQAESARLSETRQRVLAEQEGIIANDRSREAQRQSEMANQRVNDILAMANRTLFDVHDAIAPLPGSVEARRTLVSTTLSYLQNLQTKVARDDKMREVLAAAYYKVALIQGDPLGASLQDSAGAEQNLLKAQSLLRPVYRSHPDNSAVVLLWLQLQSELIELTYHSGRQQEATKAYIPLLPVAHRLFLKNTCGLPCDSEEANLESVLASDLLAFDPVQALEHANRSAASLRELLLKYPAELSLKAALGSVTASAAGAYLHTGDLEKAGEAYRQSIEMREALLRKEPNNADVNRDILVAYGNYATLLGIPWSQNLGRPQQARIYAAKAVAIARAMVDADPKDITARHNLGMILGRLGMIDPSPEETSSSLANLEEAQSLIEPIAIANPKSSAIANHLALVLEYEGYRLESLGRSDEAVAAFRKAMALLQPFLDQSSSPSLTEYLANEQGLALMYARMGNAAALDLAQHARIFAEQLTLQLPTSPARVAGLAKAWATLAAVQSRMGDRLHARQSASKALELWNSIQSPGILTAYRKPMADTHQLLDSTATK